MRYEVNAVMVTPGVEPAEPMANDARLMFQRVCGHGRGSDSASGNIVFDGVACVRGPASPVGGILAEGAMTLPVTLSGGVLFAS